MKSNSGRDFCPGKNDIWLCLSIIIIGSLIWNRVESASNDDLWRKFKPVAMDETVTLVTSKPGFNRGLEVLEPEYLIQPTRRPRENELYPPFLMQQAVWQKPTRDPANFIPRYGRITDYKEWKGEDVKDKVYTLSNSTPKLAELINQREPTFVVPGQMARMVHTNRGDRSEQVLAKYKVIVPILIPAIKLKDATTKRPRVHYVKEQITEMVPVKKNMPVVNEVIKAVEVPQQVVTDYVATHNQALPQRIDSSVNPGEELISSEVQSV